METDKAERIKKLIKEKFEVVSDIDNAEFAIVVKDELVDQETQKRNYEIGIGKAMKFPTKVSVNGKTYRTDELDEVKEGAVLLPVKELAKKNDPRFGWLLVRVPKQFNRAIDEAAWAGNLKTLDDIIKVIEAF
ncbi:MAG: hypothetical protein JW839_23080 [Candidatus Lokiarchaeota archaeon]|nr:hypothetical protein [Candidatus Lokiarchaeota archaeon]